MDMSVGHAQSLGIGPAEPGLIRKATQMIVAIGRVAGRDAPTIRNDVCGAIKEALTGTNPWRMLARVPGSPQPQNVLTLAGLYRQIMEQCDVDREDLYKQETWYSIVQRALDEALAAHTGTSAS
jgi:hypothetical protein